jgi:septal ring factor EnvC (AmiA/AmiB activator)
MNLERAIEFLIKNQARMDARLDAKFDRADQRFAQTEKRLDRLERAMAQNNRIVSRLTRYGVSLRSDVRRTERNLARISETLSETDGKLNALIDFVDRQTRGDGQQK